MLSTEGYFVLKGREAETILTPNGHKIYPSEIENLLYQIPGVEEAVLCRLVIIRNSRQTSRRLHLYR